MANKHDLVLLLERPTEPVFVPKGKEYTIFDLPLKFLIERYRPLVNEIENIFGEIADKRIPVRDIAIPDLEIPISMDRWEQFSLLMPRHRRIAGRLIDIFMAAESIEDLQSLAVYVRDRVNPYLFNYTLSVALLNRSDTKDIQLPSLAHVFPNKFVDAVVIPLVREEVTIVPEGSRMPILMPHNKTFSNLEPEHRLWYFREDMAINLYNWQWHLLYPVEAKDLGLVKKERRGELFYYKHQQINARYNVERFCNNLARVKSRNNFRAPLSRGYFPKIDSLTANRVYPARWDNAPISNIKRESDEVDISIADLELYRKRLLEAIKQGFAIDDSGKHINLDERHGIEVLGHLVEGSLLSPNRAYYGDIFNMIYLLISFCHDPESIHLEPFNILADPATAMRDPLFFEILSHINDIFEDHKSTLPAYSLSQLECKGLAITGVQVSQEGSKANVLSTFWQQSDIDVYRGMDYMPRGSIFVRFTHLQHESFTYTIDISNSSSVPRQAIVRIFLAPKNDEKGQPILFKNQRLLMVELDKFDLAVNPGLNTIRRRSNESSVIIPYERIFKEEKPTPTNSNSEKSNKNFCGWPEHMLLPKGTPEGKEFQLFVIISSYEDSQVGNSAGFSNDKRDCFNHDNRALGFPFDRIPSKDVDFLANFATPNMFVTDVVIRHEDRTNLRPVQ